MNLSHLRYFVKLAQIKHYTKNRRIALYYPAQSESRHFPTRKRTRCPSLRKRASRYGLDRLWQAVFRQRQFITQYSRQRYRNDKSGSRGNGIIRIGCLRTLGSARSRNWLPPLKRPARIRISALPSTSACPTASSNP